MKRFVDEFIEYMKNVKKSSVNTLESYKRDINTLMDFLLSNGVIDISKVTATNINSYILYLEKIGKSSSTIVRNISSMKTFFHYMLLKGYINGEPTELIKPPKAEKKHAEVNSAKTIKKLLAQPDISTPMGMRDKAMFELIHDAGVKVSDVIEIRLSDVNMKMDYIIYNDGKKEKMIQLNKSVRKSLSQYIDEGRNQLIKGSQTDFLFVNCRGGKLSRQGLWKILKENAQAAGVEEEVTPFTLGHSK